MNLHLIDHVKSNFKHKYKTNPILVFAPGRINLIGDHTDYNDGYVFPAAIDKGIVAAINKSNAEHSSIIALDVNEQLNFTLENTQSISSSDWKNYVIGVVAEIQKVGKQIGNFNLVFGGDIPVGAGLSSSAALENSVVFGLNELFQLGLSKKDMIFISQKAEHNFASVKCGIMDQYASMFGKKDTAILLDCQSLIASIVEIDLREYEILLINTNVKHNLAESEYNERRSTCELVASLLNLKSLRDASEKDLFSIKHQISVDYYQKILYVIQENQRVTQAFDAIKNNDLELFGKLLYASHKGLQHQYKVSCDELDYLVNKAKNTQYVLGARMMGGGFGGCTINFIKKDAVSAYSDSIKKSYQKHFNKECSIYNITLSQGTHLINI